MNSTMQYHLLLMRCESLTLLTATQRKAGFQRRTDGPIAVCVCVGRAIKASAQTRRRFRLPLLGSLLPGRR